MCQEIKVSDLSPPKILKLNAVSNKVAANGQGLLQGWNSLLVRPEPLLIKDMTRPEKS